MVRNRRIDVRRESSSRELAQPIGIELLMRGLHALGIRLVKSGPTLPRGNNPVSTTGQSSWPDLCSGTPSLSSVVDGG